MGMTAGVIGVTAGVAAAATRSATVTAKTAPNISGAIGTYKVGTVTVSWSTTATFTGTMTLTLSATSGTPTWNAAPTATRSGGVTIATVHAVAAANTTTVVTVAITKANGTSGSVTFGGVEVHANTALSGNVSVKVAMTNSGTTFVFSPTKVVVAHGPAAVASSPHAITLAAHTRSVGTATPLAVGKSNQSAGTWAVTVTFTSTSEGWTSGNTLAIQLGSTVGPNCATGTKFVTFASAPSVAVTAKTTHGLSTTPTFSVSLTHATPCATSLEQNVALITFTNSGRATSTSAQLALNVTGVKYNVGSGTTVGEVTVPAADYQNATGTVVSPSVTKNAAPNGYVSNVHVSANTPVVTVAAGSYDAKISPVKIVETKAHMIPTGYVCLSFPNGALPGTPATGTGNAFNTAATPTVKVTGGAAKVTSKASFVKVGTVEELAFKVTSSSTVTPSTFVVTGIAVNATSTPTAMPLIVAEAGGTSNCASFHTTPLATPTAVDNATAFFVGPEASQVIGGATADATAVKLLEHTFTTSGGNCVGNTTTARPVVLATTGHFQDALSAQYLASYLHTGVLLTPYKSLPQVDILALKAEGVTQVYIVGGPLAVSTTVMQQLKTLPSYVCGGASERTSDGHTQFVSVTRLYGQTAEGTALAIDRFVPSSHVMKAAFVNAYAGTNATKGTGMYNDTSGLSSVPTTGTTLPTAIMASGAEFQDAMAASTTSYWQNDGRGFPIILTSPTALTATASAALITTGVKQVILMGGPLAVTNTVVKTLEAQHVQVLRIAGKTYNDTATQLAKFEYGTAGTTGLGWTSSQASVARGNGFTDGLTGAVVAGDSGIAGALRDGTTVPEPLLLTTNPTTVGTYLTAFLKAYGQSGPSTTRHVSSLLIFGGSLAVSPTVISKMETDIS